MSNTLSCYFCSKDPNRRTVISEALKEGKKEDDNEDDEGPEDAKPSGGGKAENSPGHAQMAFEEKEEKPVPVRVFHLLNYSSL